MRLNRETFDTLAGFVQIVLNILAFLASYAIGALLHLVMTGQSYGHANDISVQVVLPCLVILYLVLWLAYRLPVSYETPTFEMILNESFVAMAIALASLAISFGVRAFAFPRSLIGTAFIVQVLLLSALNFGCAQLYRRWRPRIPVVWVGTDGYADLVAECLERSVATFVVAAIGPGEITANFLSTLQPETILVLSRSVPVEERDRILRLSTALCVPVSLLLRSLLTIRMSFSKRAT